VDASLTESIDTTTPQEVLIFPLAEFERALIRERTRAGLKSAKFMGRTGGRPPKLTEDDLDVARTLLANPDITVADVARPARRVASDPVPIFARRAGGA
jgi:DNA invertase Pin-like site-specific DNA recombinase